MSLADTTTTPASTPAPAPSPAAPQPQQSDPPGERSKVVSEVAHEIPANVDPLLVQILSWPRRDDSVQELQFCKFLREHIKGLAIPGATVEIMAGGCLAVTVPRPGKPEDPTPPKPSTTLFSSHVDTVEGHASDTVWSDEEKKWVSKPAVSADVRKRLTYDPNFGLIALDKDSIGGSLGADDGAGVWLMVKMIERRVPGTYLFHRSEEVGGKGSAEMVRKHTDWLAKFECAVAFDRHDTFEVIHTQGGSRCASAKFTDALCDRLNKQGMQYEPSQRGVFTDTKNYRGIIPECVNVAVGYQSQHGRNETLDYGHLNALLDAVCAIDWDSLPIDRDPKIVEAGSYGYGRHNWTTRGGRDSLFDDDEDFEPFPRGYRGSNAPHFDKSSRKKPKNKGRRQQAALTNADPILSVSEELSQHSLEELETWATDNPIDAAKAIGQLLVEVAQMRSTVTMTMQLLGWKEDN
jgi:hypothetical protein